MHAIYRTTHRPHPSCFHQAASFALSPSRRCLANFHDLHCSYMVCAACTCSFSVAERAATEQQEGGALGTHSVGEGTGLN